ncbi:MAG: NAD(P)-binding domain-containing protein [Acidimicrobiales bacterium]|jgi:putative flavoprotein involved in K+ transport
MHTSVVVVGAGPGGLAMSHHLTGAGVDHVLLERGEVAHAWRTERWDSLRLLTPNWMTALPGARYEGDDPDGYMTASETVATLDAYRSSFDPPLRTGIEVEAACHTGTGFEVRTSEGTWRCDALVAATGGSSEPRIPAVASELPPSVQQFPSLSYRRPAQIDDRGRVLVVGASASGVQIADELRRAGRDVAISVGEHIRLPRSYRGCDIYAWLDRIGQLDEGWQEVDDLQRARRHASVQVVGSDDGREVDLHSLQALGVQLVGRLMAIRGTTALCSGGLGSLVANADLKQARLLRRIDEWVDEHGMADLVGPAVEPSPTVLTQVPTELDLAGFTTVIWATGFRPTYRWLDPRAHGRGGRVDHDGGVGSMPGLYLLGLPFLRRRRSNLLAGLGLDAAELGQHLVEYLGTVGRLRTPLPR